MIEKPNTQEALSQDLLKLFAKNDYSDIQFQVEDKIINAHRNVIASRCKYIETLLKSTPCSHLVAIENISYDTFKVLLHYLYTGNIDNNCNGKIICELIRASKLYELENLNKVAYSFIKENLCHENVIDMIVEANKNEPHLDTVEKLCLSYIARNFKSVLNHPDFKKLDKDILVRVTQYYAQFFEDDKKSLKTSDKKSKWIDTKSSFLKTLRMIARNIRKIYIKK